MSPGARSRKGSARPGAAPGNWAARWRWSDALRHGNCKLLKPTRPTKKIERIDGLNLTVADIDRSVAFYQNVLGMEIESMGEGRAALHFGRQKIHLDAAGGRMAMAGDKRMPAHICFITEAPMGEVAAHLEQCGVPVRMQGRAPARSARSNPSISTTPTRTRSRSPATERRFRLTGRTWPTPGRT